MLKVATSAAVIQPEPSTNVALGALFVAFLKVALGSFGGGLVWARRVVVEQRRWLNEEEFADILSLCQFLPGPNIVGITLCVGSRLRGAIGALASVSGFLLLPWTIGFSLGVLYLRYADLPPLQHVLRGLSATAAGLLIATGIRLLTPYRRRPTGLIFAAFAFVGLVLAKLPLLVVLLGLAPISIATAAIAAASGR